MFKPTWDEYLQQLKLHKPTAPAIFNLIYMGAMDEFIETLSVNNMPTYAIMVEQVKKTLKSKANLSKGYKTDSIGLAAVKSPLDLARWRLGYNPVSKTNLVDLFKDYISGLGFRKEAHPIFSYTKNASEEKPAAKLTTKLAQFLSKYPGTPMFNSMSQGETNLVLFMLVTDLKFFKYQNGAKEALKLTGFTGDEILNDIVLWPDRSGTVPSRFLQVIKKNEGLLIQIKPQLKNGIAGYRIAHISSAGVPKES